MTEVLSHPVVVVADGGVTWGITGPQFLLGYLVLLVIAVIFALVGRHRALSRDDQPQIEPSSLTPTEIAMLTGGPTLVITVALTTLRAGGYLADNGKVANQLGPLDKIDPIARATYGYLANQKNNRQASSIANSPDLVQPLADLRAFMQRRGLIHAPEQISQARRALWPVAAVFAVGAIRFLAGLDNNKPVAFLAFLLFGTLAIGVMLWNGIPTVPPDTREALSRLRNENKHLRANMNPAWSTYGPGAVALGVGLFGAYTLWNADPALAEASRIPLDARGTGTAFSSGCSGSSSGIIGSTDSGGGGGSSCGGGISCGGGCGGGGCGG